MDRSRIPTQYQPKVSSLIQNRLSLKQNAESPSCSTGAFSYSVSIPSMRILYLRKNRLNHRRLFGTACSSVPLSAARSSSPASCCCIVPAWRACAARAVSCAASNAVLHSASLAFNSLICSSFTASCACSVSTVVCKTPTKSQTSWFAVCDWLAFVVCDRKLASAFSQT